MRVVPPIMMAGSTIVVGLNGALQKRFVLPLGDRLVPGNVHRAGMVDMGVGGKGQDVAVTLSCLKFCGRLRLAQFCGKGAEGDLVYEMLQELLGESAMQLTIRPDSGMRTCTSIVAADATTELVEPSGMITSSDMNQLFDQLSKEQASALCIMGSMPPGCDDETYAEIYKRVATPKTLCLIDSVAGLTPLLQRIANTEPRGSTILKINASELCRLAQVERAATESETSGVRVDDLITAVSKFLERSHPHAAKALNAIAITDGAYPAYLAALPVAPEENEFRLFQLPVAKLTTTETLYPIGAGDAVAAGTLAAWKFLTDDPDEPACVPLDVQTALQGNQSPSTRAMLASFAFGLACGTASCMQEQNSVLKLQDVCELLNKEGRPVFLSSHKIS